MERYSRPTFSIRLIAFCTLVLAVACKGDPTPVTPVKQNSSSPVENSADPNGTVIGADGIPTQIDGKKVTNVTTIEGGLKEYQGVDPKGDGRQKAIREMLDDNTGFAGVSPCKVITPQDLVDWPGGLGNVSSKRNNLGQVIMGCIYNFQPTATQAGGSISIYFSDNQTAAKAAESVQLMPTTSKGSAVLLNDWEAPAAFDKDTGEFVWSEGQNFITLLIAHPAVAKEQEKWSRKIASVIRQRMQEAR